MTITYSEEEVFALIVEDATRRGMLKPGEDYHLERDATEDDAYCNGKICLEIPRLIHGSMTEFNTGQ